MRGCVPLLLILALIGGCAAPRDPATLQQAAAAGEARAQCELAVRLLDGDGVPADAEAAWPLLAAAAAQGDPEALARHAWRLLDTGCDPTVAYTLLRRSADAGSPLGKRMRAGCLVRGEGVPADPAAGAAILRQLADDDLDAATDLARLEVDGIGMPTDVVSGVARLWRAVDGGCRRARYRLGQWLRTGHAVPKDETAGLALIRQAAEQGHPGAMVTLGRTQWREDATTTERAEALDWFAKAAARGESEACAWIGLSWMNGDLGRDPAKARIWYRRGALLGDNFARCQLADLLLHGTGGPANPAEAQRLLRAASADGDRHAQLDLAKLILWGEPRGDDAEALTWATSSAEMGRAEAMTLTGWLHEVGRGTTVDPAAAAAWYRRGSEAGDPGGTRCLAVLTAAGLGVPRDLAAAAALFRQAAEAGDLRAMYRYGWSLESGEGIPADQPQALIWYARTHAAGNLDGAVALGLCRIDGTGCTADAAAGEALLREAATAGNRWGQRELGRVLDGRNTTATAEARRWLRSAGEAGDASALRMLGVSLARGDGTTGDIPAALALYERAAAAGDGLAAWFLAARHALGNGVAADQAASIRWLRRGDELGQGDARLRLADRLFDGEDLPANPAAALTLLERGHADGHAGCSRRLAIALRNGEGIPRQLERGTAMLQAAAASGLAAAQLDWGMAHFQGIGVAQDRQVAFTWFTKAAAQGDSQAAYNLGVCYEQGLGTTADAAEAARQFHAAAEAGHLAGRRAWAACLARGHGVPADPAQAAALAQAAAADGDAQAGAVWLNAVTAMHASWSATPGATMFGESVALTADDLAAPASSDEELRAAVAVARDLASAALDPRLGSAASDALRASLAQLDGTTPEATQLRRLIATPWADGLIISEALSGLRQALALASTCTPRARWSASATSMTRLQDAWGWTVWSWSAADRTAYAVSAPVRAHRTIAPLQLIVDLPPGADPWRDVSRATAVRLVLGPSTVATWRPGSALTVADEVWNLANGIAGDDDEEAWPLPVLPLADPSGRIHRLLVGAKCLDAPADAGADAEAFLERCAATMREPAELAAIGDYLFTYTYDSPDPAAPRLIGSEGRCSDIHQTALATMSTALDGRFRGDCDDLAEIYTTILGRQGVLAHVLDLDNHAAAGYLRHESDEWAMHILHSGPAHRFSAAKPQDAVVAAYDQLAANRRHRRVADAIGVLLRFAGENTRSRWQLGWRIFSDPAYAATMVAVQRDWHFRTYHHGIIAMERQIAGGDRDPANFSELSGLHRRIGAWDEAVSWHRRGLAAAGGQATTAQRLAQIRLLTQGGRHAEAATATQAVTTSQIKPLAKDGFKAVSLAVELHGCLSAGANRDARQTLAETWIIPWFDGTEPAIRTYLDGTFDAAVWGGDPLARAWREAGGVVVGLRYARWVTEGRRAGTPTWRWLDWWYGRICALPLGPQADQAWCAQTPISWMVDRVGESRASELIGQARLPEAGDPAKPPRFDGAPGTALAARWARVCVPFWCDRVSDAAGLPDAADRNQRIRAGLAELDAAITARTTIAPAPPNEDEIVLRALLAAAITLDDDGMLADILSRIAVLADRELDESTAGMIGSWGRRLPEARFTHLLERWYALRADRAFALEIAWAARSAGGGPAIRLAAEAARNRWPDDQVLAAEAAWLTAASADPAKP